MSGVNIAKRKLADAVVHHDRFVDVVRSAYNKLPKHGKPSEVEMTVVAAVVMKSQHDSVSLISLATGTKCIAHANRRADGSIVHDLHAEVLARRAAMYWLYTHLKDCVASDKQTGVLQHGALEAALLSCRSQPTTKRITN